MKTIIALMVTVILGIGAVVFYFTISNEEIRTRELVLTQQTVCEAHFDKMWKILKSKAGVTEQYSQSFKEIYPALIAGRYSNDQGTLMKWIQEDNPTFSTELFKDLMVSIEAQRESYFDAQKSLIDIHRKHNTLLKVAPSSWIVGNRGEIAITIITSEITEKVYSTGQENDINLFSK